MIRKLLTSVSLIFMLSLQAYGIGGIRGEFKQKASLLGDLSPYSKTLLNGLITTRIKEGHYLSLEFKTSCQKEKEKEKEKEEEVTSMLGRMLSRVSDSQDEDFVNGQLETCTSCPENYETSDNKLFFSARPVLQKGDQKGSDFLYTSFENKKAFNKYNKIVGSGQKVQLVPCSSKSKKKDSPKRSEDTAPSKSPNKKLLWVAGGVGAAAIGGALAASGGGGGGSEEGEKEKKVVKKEEREKKVVKKEEKEKEEKEDLAAALGTKTPDHQSEDYYRSLPEYQKNAHAYDAIKLAAAHGRGWTGKGSILGVIDNGFKLDHDELQGQIIAHYGADMPAVHGTHVAAITAGKRQECDDDNTFECGSHGVAPDAKLVLGTATDPKGAMTYGNAVEILGKMVRNHDVAGVGLSFASPWAKNQEFKKNPDGTISLPTARAKQMAELYKDAIGNSEVVLVKGAGNDGAATVTEDGLAAVQVDKDGNLILGGQMILVGSWNPKTQKISPYSNRAGHVCQNYDNNAKKCKDKHRVSDYYILAVGDDILAAYSLGKSVKLSGTSMSTPMVNGAVGIVHQMWPYMKGNKIALLLLKTANKNIPGYNKNIHGQGLLDLERATQPVGKLGLPTGVKVTGRRTKKAGGAMTMPAGSASDKAKAAFAKVTAVDTFDRDFTLDFSGAVIERDSSPNSFDEVVSGKNNNGENAISFSPTPDTSVVSRVSQDGNRKSMAIERDFSLGKKGDISLVANVMNEKKTWLGNRMSGSFGTLKGANTVSLGLKTDGIEVVPDSGFEVFGDVHVGRTVASLDSSAGSLIEDMSPITSTFWSAGVKQKLDRKGNKTLGFKVGQGVSVRDGSMSYSIPNRVDRYGNVYRNQGRIDLDSEAPVGLEASYTVARDNNRGTSLKVSGTANITGEPDYGVMVNVRKSW